MLRYPLKRNNAWYQESSLALNGVMPSLIHNYTKDEYYNSSAGVTGFPFTATRTTNAMMFDGAGRLVWAPAQMCTRGQDFTLGWSMGSDGTVALSGNTTPNGIPAYTLTWTTPTPSAGCAITAQPAVLGTSMTLSVYLRYVNHQWARVYLYSNAVVTNGIVAYVDLINKTFGVNGISGVGTSYIGGSVTDVGNGWVRVTISGNPNAATSTDLGILVASAQANGIVTRVGNNAAIEVAGALLQPWDAAAPSQWQSEFNTAGTTWYGPRIINNPATGAPLGVLVEEAKTNDITAALDLTTSSATGPAGTLSAGPTYLGGWKSIRYTADGTNNSHFAYTSSVTPSASQVRSVSAIVGYVDTQFIQVATSANFPADAVNTYINVDMLAGTVTATGSSVSSGYCRALGNNVYHIGFTFTCSGTPAGGAGCLVAAIPTGTSTRLFGASLSTSFDVIYLSNLLGTGYASVIPCFGTATTKATDVLQWATGSVINASKGTLYMVSHRLAGTSGVAHQPVVISDNTLNNRIQTQVSGSVGMVHRSGGSNYDYSGSTTIPAIGSDFKIAVRYSATGARYVGNGGTVVSSGTAVAPAAITTLYIGANAVGTATYSIVKEIRYYNDDTATDAQLQALTT
jgi:hypothetical protein